MSRRMSLCARREQRSARLLRHAPARAAGRVVRWPPRGATPRCWGGGRRQREIAAHGRKHQVDVLAGIVSRAVPVVRPGPQLRPQLRCQLLPRQRLQQWWPQRRRTRGGRKHTGRVRPTKVKSNPTLWQGLLLRHEVMRRGWVLQWRVRATHNMWQHIALGSRRRVDGLLGGRLSCLAPLKMLLLLARHPRIYLGEAGQEVGIERGSRTVDLAHLQWLHVVTRRRRALRSLKVVGPVGEHLHLGHLRLEPWERAQPILGATAIELARKWHASNVVLQASTEGPKMCSAMRTWVRPHAGRLGAAHPPQPLQGTPACRSASRPLPTMRRGLRDA